MGIFRRLFSRKPTRPDPQQLQQTILAFIRAENWAESKRIVAQHPELLTDEADVLLAQLITVQTDERAVSWLTGHRELLRHCRAEGVDAAFALLVQLGEPAAPDGPTSQIPAGFEAEVQELLRLRGQEQRDPGVRRQQVALLESMLRRLLPGQYSVFRAALLNELGVAYRNLPTGDRADNLQQAIDCYREALTVCTPEAAPFDYAMTQNNLGAAYWALPTGDRADNLKQAIACYREALTVYTPEAAPFEYAMTQNNLGAAYANLPTGDRADNLKQAIACWREALTIYTPEAAPFEYAGTQNNLGAAYWALPTGDRADNLKQAIACYREALTVYTPEAAPDGHRRTARNLGNLHLGQRRWLQAHTAYATAIAAADLLHQAAATEVARQAELAEAMDLFPNDAYCLAQLGRFTEAVERLEAGKARALAEALARDRAALEEATPEDREAFEAARDRIQALEAEARAVAAPGLGDPTARSFTKLSSDLRAGRQELAEVVNRIRTYVPDFMPAGLDFEAIAGAAAPASPLVYLITTPQGSLALIVPPGAETLDAGHVVRLDDFTDDDVNRLLEAQDANGNVIGGYLVGQVGGDVPLLQAALEQALPILREWLMAPLAARLIDLGFRQVTLIAGGQLDLLPLHAAAFETLTFTYAPSARALQAAANAARERAGLPAVLLGIGNPLPNPKPLAFARAEVEAIAPLFEGEAQRVLYEHQATRADTLQKLAGATHLHFSCHGIFDVEEPLDSALFLSGNDTLTLRDLLDGDLDLSASRLAVLSACQTGITDFLKVPDEAVGFPAGFLQAGVPGVVSTLWPVADVSTALLLARFYRYYLQDGLEPAEALHQAQDWLRTATVQEMGLGDYYERLYQESGETDKWAFKWMSYCRDNPDATPFEHPYYWAAFTFSGA
ncbi:MAG: hypothetical protein AMJ93_09430 [Anaerolineae bacterium SM23_84]|nr:MAG: hypothetical protein AMJ93_09430 [Anaerolineae bacterium SM23_84]